MKYQILINFNYRWWKKKITLHNLCKTTHFLRAFGDKASSPSCDNITRSVFNAIFSWDGNLTIDANDRSSPKTKKEERRRRRKKFTKDAGKPGTKGVRVVNNSWRARSTPFAKSPFQALKTRCLRRVKLSARYIDRIMLFTGSPIKWFTRRHGCRLCREIVPSRSFFFSYLSSRREYLFIVPSFHVHSIPHAIIFRLRNIDK